MKESISSALMLLFFFMTIVAMFVFAWIQMKFPRKFSMKMSLILSICIPIIFYAPYAEQSFNPYRLEELKKVTLILEDLEHFPGSRQIRVSSSSKKNIFVTAELNYDNGTEDEIKDFYKKQLLEKGWIAFGGEKRAGETKSGVLVLEKDRVSFRFSFSHKDGQGKYFLRLFKSLEI
jgi:hypothetical protein